MYDPTNSYRSSQVASSSPAARVVLLYQGAIRFGMQHLGALERGDREAAHNASIRCQAIVSSLQEVLDMDAGPVAKQLDRLYDFVLHRLVAGNVEKDPAKTQEALHVLRGLLQGWQAISGPSVEPAAAAPGLQASAAPPAPPAPVLAGATASAGGMSHGSDAWQAVGRYTSSMLAR